AAIRAELEDLEGANRGIHNPVESDPERSVLAHLLDAVAPRIRRARRDDLNHDVGWHGHETTARRLAAWQVDVGIRLAASGSRDAEASIRHTDDAATRGEPAP